MLCIFVGMSAYMWSVCNHQVWLMCHAVLKGWRLRCDAQHVAWRIHAHWHRPSVLCTLRSVDAVAKGVPCVLRGLQACCLNPGGGACPPLRQQSPPAHALTSCFACLLPTTHARLLCSTARPPAASHCLPTAALVCLPSPPLL